MLAASEPTLRRHVVRTWTESKTPDAAEDQPAALAAVARALANRAAEVSAPVPAPAR